MQAAAAAAAQVIAASALFLHADDDDDMKLTWQPVAWLEGAEGAVSPSAADEGVKIASPKYFNDRKSEFAYSKRNTKYTHLVYLALILFVFPRFCIHAVLFCSELSLCRKS